MLTLIYILLLLYIFYLLAVICDEYFVRSLDVIAQKLKLSNDVAGATLMAIGSSAPELFTSMIALAKVGVEDVGTGTIVGSAIFNILVIVGASALVSRAYLNWKPVVRDMAVYCCAIIILVVTFRDGQITFLEALIYLLIYSIYIYILWKWRSWIPDKHKSRDELETVTKEVQKGQAKTKKSGVLIAPIVTVTEKLLKYLFPSGIMRYKKGYLYLFFTSIFAIAILSWALVESAVGLAQELNIPKAIIALTILAAGTSIPDLLSSIIVAKDGRGDMAISNAVGSNSFDILIGLGLPWFIYTIFKGNVYVSTDNLNSSIILLFFTVVSVSFIIALRKFSIGRKSGILLLALYGGYLLYAVTQI